MNFERASKLLLPMLVGYSVLFFLLSAEAIPSCHKAVALLRPTKGNKAQGVATFSSVPGGVKIVVEMDHLEPGKHGLIIHEYGDCSATDGASIGRHFNPKLMKHGGPDSLERHVGDLGNIVADETGHGYYERVDNLIALEGPHCVVGRAIAVHANPDDFKTQPTGNVGGCVACGVID